MHLEVKKILIIRLSSIGDVLLTTPVINILKNKFPQSELSFLVEDKSQDIIQKNHNLDNVIVFSKKELKNISSKKGKISAFKYLLKFIKNLKNKDFDLVIDLHNVFRSGIFSFFTFANVRIGLRKQLISYLYTNKLNPLPQKHVVDEYLLTLKAININYEGLKKEFTLDIPKHKQNKIDKLFIVKNNRGIKNVAIVPSTSRSEKNWSEKNFAKLSDWLIKQKKVKLFLLGSPSEKEKCLRIKHLMDQKPIILAGKTDLMELSAVIKRVDLLITGDTAPLHIAMALGTKLIGLYGPTSPQRYGPYKGNNIVIKSENENINNITLQEVKEKVELFF